MNVIVVGCGRVGGHLANLLSDEGHNVSVIDRTEAAFKSLGRDFDGSMIRGVGFDADVLEAAGAKECDAVAAVTSSDNTNMMVASVAREVFHVEHVITRLYDPKCESTYRKLNIDCACGTTLVAESIFTKIHAGSGHHISSYGDFEIMDATLAFENGAMSCGKFERAFDARVMLVEHEGEMVMPEREMLLYKGDIVLICIDRSRIMDLSEITRM